MRLFRCSSEYADSVTTNRRTAGKTERSNSVLEDVGKSAK